MITGLEELKFEGGYPTAETIQKLYDQLGLQRAAQTYLDFMPAASVWLGQSPSPTAIRRLGSIPTALGEYLHRRLQVRA
jgi:hypothetical protein